MHSLCVSQSETPAGWPPAAPEKVLAGVLTLRPNGGIQFRAWNDDSSPNCADGGTYELAHRLTERQIMLGDLR